MLRTIRGNRSSESTAVVVRCAVRVDKQGAGSAQSVRVRLNTDHRDPQLRYKRVAQPPEAPPPRRKDPERPRRCADIGTPARANPP